MKIITVKGELVVSQLDGQVCFLQIYQGNKKITLRQLEESLGLSYSESRPDRARLYRDYIDRYLTD